MRSDAAILAHSVVYVSLALIMKHKASCCSFVIADDGKEYSRYGVVQIRTGLSLSHVYDCRVNVTGMVHD